MEPVPYYPNKKTLLQGYKPFALWNPFHLYLHNNTNTNQCQLLFKYVASFQHNY